MRLLLISSTIVHGYGYLDYDEDNVRRILGDRKRVAVIPFAQYDLEATTTRIAERFARLGCTLSDLQNAEVIFASGGNTFRLLKALYERKLLDPIRDAVRNRGVVYIGSSAGTNITAPTIKTTNDMPIVYPPSFDALGLVPFQINPHYLDPDPNSTHKGETREERLREYLQENETPVVGLREGSTLLVEDEKVTLLGTKTARVFRRGAEPEEMPPGILGVRRP
jgi:dipeptidase E